MARRFRSLEARVLSCVQSCDRCCPAILLAGGDGCGGESPLSRMVLAALRFELQVKLAGRGAEYEEIEIGGKCDEEVNRRNSEAERENIDKNVYR